MVSGSLLIHGPPVISGAGCPTRVVTAWPPRGAAAAASIALSPTAVIHVHSVFMMVRLASHVSAGVTRLSILPPAPPDRRLDSPRPAPIMQVARGWAWARPDALAPISATQGHERHW